MLPDQYERIVFTEVLVYDENVAQYAGIHDSFNFDGIRNLLPFQRAGANPQSEGDGGTILSTQVLEPDRRHSSQYGVDEAIDNTIAF